MTSVVRAIISDNSSDLWQIPFERRELGANKKAFMFLSSRRVETTVVGTIHILANGHNRSRAIGI